MNGNDEIEAEERELFQQGYNDWLYEMEKDRQLFDNAEAKQSEYHLRTVQHIKTQSI